MTDNPILKEIMEKTQPLPDIDGFMWLNMLIRFNTRTGEAFIERSFSKPADMSKIKHLTKPKKKKAEKVSMNSVSEEETLFD